MIWFMQCEKWTMGPDDTVSNPNCCLVTAWPQGSYLKLFCKNQISHLWIRVNIHMAIKTVLGSKFCWQWK